MHTFGIDCKIVAINKGPVITLYELEPAPGVKLNKIVALSDNLAMALASSDIRIEAPIPGKAVVGIEVPNKFKDSVSIRDMIGSLEFKNLKSDIPLTLGKNVAGEIIVSSIEKMPHLLIAGATGSGKSVCINTIITSILYKSSPEDVKLLLIDPKIVELSIYNDIPHLLIPVVTEPKKASFALNWAVGEMERRYSLFAELGVRDLNSFNSKAAILKEPILPKIVIIVDELADLMMVAQKEVEEYIARLAQKARAAGIYLILATQRPSVDVITGTIKANIPSRIAFSVSSQIDSRTILDMPGAERLLGKGDMLFYPGFYSKPVRVQGAFIHDDEVERVVEFIKANSSSNKALEEKIVKEIQEKKEITRDRDELFNEAVKYILTDEQASISYLQRKLKIGYSRAARIVDQLEESGIIGPHEGSKPRKVLLTEEEIKEMLGEEFE
ncbi:stage III sporulation protein E [Peptoniphilus indolicus ATCC 29427]|uniref:Stage III sporulation protein E n=2 Tax=Peptoniphilus indolicus TaxID=33030 RepID=G4D5N5_9FIRM|nr:stage III sporulation protein E [Peptoniphilus indolicus ATCC 29427]